VLARRALATAPEGVQVGGLEAELGKAGQAGGQRRGGQALQFGFARRQVRVAAGP
jgi:hypothetical protein